MKFKIYDSVSYGHMEPLVPFTKVNETDDYLEAVEFISTNPSPHFIVIDGSTIIYDPNVQILESKDGKTFTMRSMLRDNKISNGFETLQSSSFEINLGLN